jgi:hypothetical protein
MGGFRSVAVRRRHADHAPSRVVPAEAVLRRADRWRIGTHGASKPSPCHRLARPPRLSHAVPPLRGMGSAREARKRRFRRHERPPSVLPAVARIQAARPSHPREFLPMSVDLLRKTTSVATTDRPPTDIIAPTWFLCADKRSRFNEPLNRRSGGTPLYRHPRHLPDGEHQVIDRKHLDPFPNAGPSTSGTSYSKVIQGTPCTSWPPWEQGSP